MQAYKHVSETLNVIYKVSSSQEEYEEVKSDGCFCTKQRFVRHMNDGALCSLRAESHATGQRQKQIV